ncbi:MAG: sugar ABC transporter permease [Anaerolineae bacterium]|nr:sugar ABC transporter permease [Anaerolineae bacterium]
MTLNLLTSSAQRSERTAAYLFLLPAAILLIVFSLIPFLSALRLSFTNQPLVPQLLSDGTQRPAEFVGLDNYSQLLRVELLTLEPEVGDDGQPVRDDNGDLVFPRARTILRGNEQYAGMSELTQFDLFGTRHLLAASDPTWWRSLFNVLTFVVIVVPLQTSFALGLAMLVNQKIRASNFFRTVYFAPVVTSMAIVSVIWFFLYNPDQGFINNFLSIFRIGPFQWLEHPASAMLSIILISIWQGVGFQMIIFLAGLQEIPEALYEASALDGANLWQQFRFVTLPSLRNTTIFVAISTTILAFKLFVQVDVMTFGRGGPEDATITPILHLVNEGFRGSQRVGYASAIAVVFLLLVLAISLVQRRVLTEKEA